MNVLLVRADGIGDALACAPLVAALRAAGHEVSAVLGCGNSAIFAHRTFARVHVLERIPWPQHGSTAQSRTLALHEARAARYDVALVASEEMEAYRFASTVRIRRRIGFINGWEKPLKTVRTRALLTRAVVRPASASRVAEHEVETVFRLGAGLHGSTRPVRESAALAALILDEPPRPHGRIVLQASTKLSAGGLDRAAYAALARRLIATCGDVLVLGDEPEFASAIARASGAMAECGLEVAAWKARLAGARAIVTPDSGAAHVAGMLGVPCVDLFAPGPTTARDVVRWRPWAAPCRVLVLDRARTRDALADEIARAVQGLLADRPRAA